MQMKLLGKRKNDVVKEDMGEVGVKETDVEDRKVWRVMIRCGYPLNKGKGRKEKKNS